MFFFFYRKGESISKKKQFYRCYFIDKARKNGPPRDYNLKIFITTLSNIL